MITRIVKLTINPKFNQEFETIFRENKTHIEKQDGCYETNVFQDSKFSNIYFTISKWESEDALNTYRNSILFKGIWSKVKPMFCARPEAYSLIS